MSIKKCKVIQVNGLAIQELTPRENEVALKVMQDITVKQISADLRVSIRTTQSHMESIRSKVGLRGKMSLRRRLFELALSQNSGLELPENAIVVEVVCNC